MGRKIDFDYYYNDLLEVSKIKSHFDLVNSALEQKFKSFENSQNLNPQIFHEAGYQNLTQLKNNSFQENEIEAAFTLLTYIESRLRIDFRYRIKQKLKDDLSKEFRKIHSQHSNYPYYKFSLKDIIIKNWKYYFPEYKNLLDRIDSTISNFRNWVAHGRYWNPKKWDLEQYTFSMVFSLCVQFESMMGENLKTIKFD